jgi:hypothetical protein
MTSHDITLRRATQVILWSHLKRHATSPRGLAVLARIAYLGVSIFLAAGAQFVGARLARLGALAARPFRRRAAAGAAPDEQGLAAATA